MRAATGAAILIVAGFLGAAGPGHSAAEKFVSDQPSPLKVVRAKGDSTITRFTGSVELSGRFLAAWETISRERRHLRIIFMPDEFSAARLPHAAGTASVKEVMFSNAEEAVSMLLVPETAQKFLGKELLRTGGEATVTIRDYQAVIECDRRWYLARLVAARSAREVVATADDAGHPGC
jgi:hypothetical protein